MNDLDEIRLLSPGLYRVTRSKGLLVHHGILTVEVAYPGTWVVDLPPGGLRRVSPEEFADGRPVTLARDRPADPAAAARRLRRALEERGSAYHLLSHNCEHFAHRILHGSRRSLQSNAWGTVAVGLGLLLAATTSKR